MCLSQMRGKNGEKMRIPEKEIPMGDIDKKSVYRATQIMIEKASADGCETIFDRAEDQRTG